MESDEPPLVPRKFQVEQVIAGLVLLKLCTSGVLSNLTVHMEVHEIDMALFIIVWLFALADACSMFVDHNYELSLHVVEDMLKERIAVSITCCAVALVTAFGFPERNSLATLLFVVWAIDAIIIETLYMGSMIIRRYRSNVRED